MRVSCARSLMPSATFSAFCASDKFWPFDWAGGGLDAASTIIPRLKSALLMAVPSFSVPFRSTPPVLAGPLVAAARSLPARSTTCTLATLSTSFLPGALATSICVLTLMVMIVWPLDERWWVLSSKGQSRVSGRRTYLCVMKHAVLC